MNWRATVIAIFSLLPGLVSAEDARVYESIDNVFIGRIFLTPGQRLWLDLRRQNPIADPAAVPKQEFAPKREKPKTSPAGYIIKSDGSQRRWSEGDFVPSGSSSLEKMKFPGDIGFVRHQPVSSDSSEKDSGVSDIVDAHDQQD